MPARVRCHCHGKPDCQLCHGARFYPYEPGPHGWLPFRCPTCQGTGEIADKGGPKRCYTCEGAGTVDPANPPFDPGWKGLLRIGLKIMLGGG